MIRSSAERRSARDDPPFLNTVAVAHVPPLDEAGLRALLRFAKTLEAEAGRSHDPAARRDGPRPLDVDLLFAGDRTIELPPTEGGDGALTLPHPRLGRRLFVLEPLAALEPKLVLPGIGRVGAWLERVRPELARDGQTIDLVPW